MSERLKDEVEWYGMEKYQEGDKDERSSYYGGASIPFKWESTPGTPKRNHFSDCSIPPPLTPPPSFYSSGSLTTPKRQSKVRTKLTRILSMSFLDLRKRSNSSSKKKPTNNVNGSSFSWSSTSSSSSFSSSPTRSMRKPSSHEKTLKSSPTSTLSYSNSDGGRKGFSSSMESMKRAFFVVPKHESYRKALVI